ncbi:hypothetical protein PDE_01667 [Penicillium oxalicum 114-2]|uniref:Uncharacterized protein n=1 Tax=Penicillium oxalicum (strain 114-2 / CGMCC 5302) TaxID=933388 RepID=S7Z944_PENO1|nr:hypothetical protein PDE_01667 [Penicillium oxalicum 114-2]
MRDCLMFARSEDCELASVTVYSRRRESAHIHLRESAVSRRFTYRDRRSVESGVESRLKDDSSSDYVNPQKRQRQSSSASLPVREESLIADRIGWHGSSTRAKWGGR